MGPSGGGIVKLQNNIYIENQLVIYFLNSPKLLSVKVFSINSSKTFLPKVASTMDASLIGDTNFKSESVGSW